MGALSKAWLVSALLFSAGHAGAQDSLEAKYHDAIAAARSEGVTTLVRKLDGLAAEAPGAPFTAVLHETIQVIGLLHPGSVPDRPARLQALRTQAAANEATAKALKRIAVLDQYYSAAVRGEPTNAAALSDPMFEGLPAAIQALADAALRAGDYDTAETLAARVIEADPFSPLIAGAHVIVGLCNAYRGNAPASVIEFQRAIDVCPLPTLYGRTEDLLFLAYRFARPVPGAVGNLFDEEVATSVPPTPGLKDPRSMIFRDGSFTLIDRDQILKLSMEGKVTETKPNRQMDDVAAARAGGLCYLSENGLDFGTGPLTRLSWTSAGKPRTLGKLRSLAIDRTGAFYVLDQEAGLLRGMPSATPAVTMTPVAQARGRLLRMDQHGNLYILATDQRSVMVYSREGKPLMTVSPVATAGRDSSIEYFALDLLNHLYILESASIQIFAMNLGSSGLEKVHIATVPLDQRPSHKNLKVIAVASDGTVAVTGKNDDNWVIFR